MTFIDFGEAESPQDMAASSSAVTARRERAEAMRLEAETGRRGAGAMTSTGMREAGEGGPEPYAVTGLRAGAQGTRPRSTAREQPGDRLV